MMASSFHSLEPEGVHGTRFTIAGSLRVFRTAYVRSYNDQRAHSAPGYPTPAVFEQESPESEGTGHVGKLPGSRLHFVTVVKE